MAIPINTTSDNLSFIWPEIINRLMEFNLQYKSGSTKGAMKLIVARRCILDGRQFLRSD